MNQEQIEELKRRAEEEIEIQLMLVQQCEDEEDFEHGADSMKLVGLLRDLLQSLPAVPIEGKEEFDGAVLHPKYDVDFGPKPASLEERLRNGTPHDAELKESVQSALKEPEQSAPATHYCYRADRLCWLVEQDGKWWSREHDGFIWMEDKSSDEWRAKNFKPVPARPFDPRTPRDRAIEAVAEAVKDFGVADDTGKQIAEHLYDLDLLKGNDAKWPEGE